ncbi:MAG TPA: hypothetical protein VJK02_03525, partial [Anaerolineales bacterium]|nr:hypothetical protein [Anaerolineales bacterium]
QSYGYKGSFAFHGASLDQLQAQLATGNPVVVSLGANGEATPGHFVTVTGVSPDGESHGDASRWVAYNDPTLGKQVISASEFERLWGLQGNSGVAVATEPPPDVPDADNFALWTAFVAGLMALVSTTPLGKFRQGIGGRVVSTGGDAAGVSRVSKPAPAPKAEPRPAPRSDPPEKEKDDKPKKTKARFDNEIVSPPPTPKPTRPRFDQEPPPPPKPTPVARPRFDEEPLPPPVYPKVRFDEEKNPPKAPAVALMPRFDDEPFSAPIYPVARFDEEGKPPGNPASGRVTPPDVIKWDTRALKVVRGIDRATGLVVTELDGGYLSVSAPAALREELGLAGTRYLPSTVAETTGSSLLRGPLSKGSLIVSALATIGTNLYDYGLGKHKDEGIGSQVFWVSTGVDSGLAVGTGVAAALVVGVALSLGIIAAPAALALVAVVGVVASIGLDLVGVPASLKEETNQFIDDREGEWERLQNAPDQRVAPKGPPVPFP